MRYWFLLNLLWLLVCPIWAQQPTAHRRAVRGQVVEAGSRTALAQASVRLLSLPDSTFVAGALTGTDGTFVLHHTQPGHCLLHISFLGFQSLYLPLSPDRTSLTDMGTLELAESSIVLDAATVTAPPPPMQVVEDTTVYNAAAYRVTEGAVLEELIQQLPGAMIDENGKVSIHGEELKKVMVNGKEFFGGDVKTALKNLPVEIIDKLRTYDRQSDAKRITGIDDGEDEVVLDVVFKKDKGRGWFGNLNTGTGTHDRYTAKGMANRMDTKVQASAVASLNNVDDRDFPGGAWSDWKTARGNTTVRNAGIDYTYQDKQVEAGGHVSYNGTANDQNNRRTSERFGNRKSSFARSLSHIEDRSHNLRSDFRVEWRPRKGTTLLLRPAFSYSTGNNLQLSTSESFNQDPTPWLGILGMSDTGTDSVPADLRVNTVRSRNLNERNRWDGSLSLQFSRRLNEAGRNFNLGVSTSTGRNQGDRYRLNDTHYFRLTSSLGGDSLLTRNQYTATPTRQWGYTLQAAYSEPIAKATFLQLSYRFTYRRTSSDRHTFDLAAAPADDPSAFPRIDSLSKSTTYDYYNHEVALTLRVVRPKYNLSAGLTLQPQSSRLSYRLGDNRVDTLRSVFNFAPRIDFQYRFSKKSRLKVTYNGQTGQPNVENMLPIADNSNPLNIRIGNPGLKPSFTHTLRATLKLHRTEHQQTLTAQARLSAVQNDVSPGTEYNEETGGRITQPRNINGNWSGNASLAMGTSLRNPSFYLYAQTSCFYRNNVAYLYDKTAKQDEKNTSTHLQMHQRLSGTYRNDRLSATLALSAGYTLLRNKLYPDNDETPYDFAIGTRCMYTFPWQMTLTTHFVNQSRQGYNDETMNHREWICNLHLAQSLYRGRATVSLEVYDVFRQRTTLTQGANANNRSLAVFDGVQSYALARFVYRLDKWKGKKAARKPRTFTR